MSFQKQQWLALGKAYSFLGETVGYPLQVKDLDFIKQFPGFADLTLESTDPEYWAAEHYEIFHRQVSATSGAFLNQSGLAGDVDGDLTLFFLKNQFPWQNFGDSPDCLAAQLSFLARECVKASDCPASSLAQKTAIQSDYLQTFVLPWAFSLAAILQELKHPVYSCTGDLLATSLKIHSYQLNIVGLELENTASSELNNFRKVAKYLTCHRQCGLYLTRKTLTGWARKFEVAMGFGSRCDVLENLLTSAHRFSFLRELVHLISTYCTEFSQSIGESAPLCWSGIWQPMWKRTERELEALAS